MSLPARVSALVRNLLRSGHVEQQLDEEVRGYLDLLIQEKIAAGLDPDAARRAAVIELEGVEQVKERVRDVRAGAWLEQIWRDLVFGVRTELKTPAATFAIVVTLAFGVAANGVAFSLVNSFFLRPPPVEQPDRLVRIYSSYASGPRYFTVSYPDYADMRELSGVFSGALVEEPVPIEGRDFSERDTESSPLVVIVNDVLARQFWPGTSAVGKHATTAANKLYEVVGVARRTKYLTLGEDPKPFVYLPLRQSTARAMTVVARGTGDPTSFLHEVRDAVHATDGTVPLFNVTTMAEHVSVALTPATSGATVLGVVGLVALMLTSLGLYGTVAQTVSRRTYEIGVRRALGAQNRDVVWLVARQAMVLVVLGLTGGVVLGLAGSRLLRSLLYGVEATDPLVFGLAPVMLVLVCLVASCVPISRALRIEPGTALRYE